MPPIGGGSIATWRTLPDAFGYVWLKAQLIPGDFAASFIASDNAAPFLYLK